MARFDVFRNAARTRDVPYLLDVQADLLGHLRTRVVVPLPPLAAFGTPLRRLNPVFEIEGGPHVMATSELVTVDRGMLGALVGSLGEHHFAIVNAVDFVLQGFWAGR